MSVDELPAGRDLDALVAEKVMGCRVSWWSIHPNTLPMNQLPASALEVPSVSMCLCRKPTDVPPEILAPDGDGDMPSLEVLRDGRWGAAPPYSTDIAAAWAVVEHLHAVRHFRCQIEYGGDQNPRWGCRIRDDGYRPFQDSEWVESAETASLAICRTALKAVA